MKQELNHNTGARFSKVPVIYRALNAVLFEPFQTFQTPIIQDGDLKIMKWKYQLKRQNGLVKDPVPASLFFKFWL